MNKEQRGVFKEKVDGMINGPGGLVESIYEAIDEGRFHGLDSRIDYRVVSYMFDDEPRQVPTGHRVFTFTVPGKYSDGEAIDIAMARDDQALGDRLVAKAERRIAQHAEENNGGGGA